METTLQIVDDEIKDFLKSVSSIYKENAKEIQIFCPFCDDAFRKHNPKWGHLYISKENGLFYCHRCNEKGILPKLLKEYGFENSEKLNKLYKYYNVKSSIYFEKSKDNKFNFKLNEKIPRNVYLKIYQDWLSGKFDKELSYLYERLAINSIDEILFYKIAPEKNAILFCDENFNPIVKRYICGKKRYKKINPNKYYSILKKYSNGVLITEGVFDAITLFKFYNFNMSVFAILGKNYLKAVIEFAKFYVDEIIIAVDNDVDCEKLHVFIMKKLLKLKDKIFIPKIKIIYNEFGKDFNDFMLNLCST